MDIFVTEWHQDMTKFDDTAHEDIIDLLRVREWKNERETKQHRRGKGSRLQQAEDNVRRLSASN